MLLIKKPSQTVYAVAVLIASTVGIGFFGIPYTFAQAGTGIGVIFLLVIAALVLLVNLLYGEIILRTHERHQFVGYVKTYLGPWAHKINLINFWISIYGAIIGILILNGTFLAHVLEYFGPRTSPVILSTIIVAIVALLVFAGLKTVSHVDLGVMVLAISIVALIALSGIFRITGSNFVFWNHGSWFLPFGVILFSLNGMQGVPLVREVLGASISSRSYLWNSHSRYALSHFQSCGRWHYGVGDFSGGDSRFGG